VPKADAQQQRVFATAALLELLATGEVINHKPGRVALPDAVAPHMSAAREAAAKSVVAFCARRLSLEQITDVLARQLASPPQY
jgi:hypothetical protein